MEISGSFEKITQREIETVNERLKIVLPIDYSEFILKHNGGTPKRNRFIHESDSNLDFHVHFLGIGTKGQTSNDLLTVYAFTFEEVPEQILPIGDNGIGDLICIGVKEEYYGKVYYWYKDDRVEEGETPTFDNVELLTNSFQDFLDRLTDRE